MYLENIHLKTGIICSTQRFNNVSVNHAYNVLCVRCVYFTYVFFRHEVKEFVVNLDSHPFDRWTEVVKDKGPQVNIAVL